MRLLLYLNDGSVFPMRYFLYIREMNFHVRSKLEAWEWRLQHVKDISQMCISADSDTYLLHFSGLYKDRLIIASVF